MGFRWPTFINPGFDFDIINMDINRVPSPSRSGIRDILNLEIFGDIWRAANFMNSAKRIPGNFIEGDFKSDEPRIIKRCSHRDVTLAHPRGHFSFIVGLKPKYQAKAGILIGLMGRRSHSHPNTHDAFIRNRIPQVQFDVLRRREDCNDRGNCGDIGDDLVRLEVPDAMLSTVQNDIVRPSIEKSLPCFLVKDVGSSFLIRVVGVTLVDWPLLLQHAGLIQGLLHRDLIGDNFRTLPMDRCFLESV